MWWYSSSGLRGHFLRRLSQLRESTDIVLVVAFYIFPEAPEKDGEKIVEKTLENSAFLIPRNVFSQRSGLFCISFAVSGEMILRGVKMLISWSNRKHVLSVFFDGSSHSPAEECDDEFWWINGRQLGIILSGGEQQMLAVGRALLAKPRILFGRTLHGPFTRSGGLAV